MNLDARLLREAIERLPEVASKEDLYPPDEHTIYVPRVHNKALRPSVSVVVGMRGAGKSWWTAVLADAKTRGVAASLADVGSLDAVDVRVGFGHDDTNQRFPSRDTVAAMRASGIAATDIWWSVVVHHAAEVAHLDVPEAWSDWHARARWAAKPEQRQRLLTEADTLLAGAGRTLMIVLDAFDRLSNDWASVRDLTRAALVVCLELRSRRALRLKLFLRPDLSDDDRIWSFPDASKLRQGSVTLDWEVGDLYGMLFTRLASDPGVARMVRQWLTSRRFTVRTGAESSVSVTGAEDESRIKRAMEDLASPFMGADKKRGLTFRWIPLHLADASGRVSPRSWLIAFRRAAEATAGDHPTFERPLHYEGIQKGVVQASEIRVAEITEDYPWVQSLLEAARELVVPCEPADLIDRWGPKPLASSTGPKLPPRRYTTDVVRKGQAPTLIDDLADLSILYRTADGRINIPDIFRVGFGIKRKGGVRPPR